MASFGFKDRSSYRWPHSTYLQDNGYVIPEENIYNVDDMEDVYEQSKDVIKNVDLVLIYNGFRDCIFPVTQATRDLNKDTIFAEVGLMPQKGHQFIDNKGLFCESSLMGDIDWVNTHHVERFLQYRKDSMYTRYIDRVNKSENKFVLCPLQVEWDAQVTRCTEFKNIDTIKWCVEHFPDDEIVVRAHPRDHQSNIESLHLQIMHLDHPNITFSCLPRDTKTFKIYNREEDDTLTKEQAEAHKKLHSKFAWSSYGLLENCINAKAVVGLNSTSLIEASLIGKEVICLGDCPMREHLGEVIPASFTKEKTKLFSAMYNSCYRWGDKQDAGLALRRFNLV